jgi:hypothetical protein
MSLSVDGQLVTDVSGKHIDPTFKCQATDEDLDFWRRDQ